MNRRRIQNYLKRTLDSASDSVYSSACEPVLLFEDQQQRLSNKL